MEAFGIYSLKVAVILLLFWGIYRIFLQKETFYRFNRVFLLAGLLAASILPLVIIRYTIEVNSYPAIPIRIISENEYTLPATEANASENPFMRYLNLLLPIIYLTVSIFIVIFRSVGLFRLFRTIRRQKSKHFTNYQLIESSEFDGAFSFFRFIFIPSGLSEPEKEIILKHEEAHILQKHWTDLLLTNVASLIWWFNPIIRLYEKAVRNNHEYLADREVLMNYEQSDYQQMLVNHWFKTPVFPMANSFSYSNRLKRINMMKKNISNPLKKFSALLALPGICLFLWSFSEPEYIVKNSNPSEKNIAMYNGEISNIKLHEIDTKNFQSMTTLTANEATEKYGVSGQHDAIEITTKKETDNTKPTEIETINNTDNPHPVVTEEKAVCQEDTTQHVTHTKELFIETEFWNSNPDILVIIDGERNKETLETLKEKDIEFITVLKEHTAARKYGEEGKNGVILITTKKNPFSNTRITPENNDTEQDNSVKVVGYGSMNKVDNDNKPLSFNLPFTHAQNPLTLIDGARVDSLNFDPSEIYSISVLKDKSATELYGEDGKNGVILVTTKKGRIIALKESGYDIQGAITDETGVPIENALVRIAEEKISTGKNGTFTTRIIPGDWLTITVEGYAPKTIQTEKDKKQTFFNIALEKETKEKEL